MNASHWSKFVLQRVLEFPKVFRGNIISSQGEFSRFAGRQPISGQIIL